MVTEVEKLIERLEKHAVAYINYSSHGLCLEAADMLRSQQAKLEKAKEAIDNLWRVFKRERFQDMCSADDDNLTVSDIAHATLEELK